MKRLGALITGEHFWRMCRHRRVSVVLGSRLPLGKLLRSCSSGAPTRGRGPVLLEISKSTVLRKVRPMDARWLREG
jgi:hypothetical protein